MQYVQTTHILIEVKERRHDRVLDGSQIWLIPVDVEHSSHTTAADVVTGNVLQEEGLLTAERQRERERDKEGDACYHLSLRWLQWHILINCQTDISWIIPGDWDDLQINPLLSHMPVIWCWLWSLQTSTNYLSLRTEINNPSCSLFSYIWYRDLVLYHNVWLILITETLSERRQTT